MTIPSPDDKHTQEAATRYLTKAECRAFGPPGSQNEVTPVVEDGKVTAVIVYTTHVTGTREGRTRPYGHPTYRRLVEAADAAIQKPPADAAAPEIEAISTRELADQFCDAFCKEVGAPVKLEIRLWIRTEVDRLLTAASAAVAQKVRHLEQVVKIKVALIKENNEASERISAHYEQSLATARAEIESLKVEFAQLFEVVVRAAKDGSEIAMTWIDQHSEPMAPLGDSARTAAKDKGPQE